MSSTGCRIHSALAMVPVSVKATTSVIGWVTVAIHANCSTGGPRADWYVDATNTEVAIKHQGSVNVLRTKSMAIGVERIAACVRKVTLDSIAAASTFKFRKSLLRQLPTASNSRSQIPLFTLWTNHMVLRWPPKAASLFSTFRTLKLLRCCCKNTNCHRRTTDLQAWARRP